METKLKYRGFYNWTNNRPKGDWILIFCSDWNKEHWAFYAYISKENYVFDIKEIWSLINVLNWRDGDTYVELIERSDGLANLYQTFYDQGGYVDHHNALEVANWNRYIKLSHPA